MAGNKNKMNKNSSRVRTRKSNPATTDNRKGPGRIRLSFDGQTLNGTAFITNIATLVNGAAAVYPIDASTALNVFAGNSVLESLSRNLSGITKLYNTYKFITLRLEWMPFVAPGVADGGSQLYIAYTDNPEVMVSAAAGNVVTNFGLAKSSRSCKSFNAWERFTYDVPLTWRLPLFSVNSTIIDTNVDEVERSRQGMVLVGASSPSAAVALGQFRATYVMELRGLDVANLT